MASSASPPRIAAVRLPRGVIPCVLRLYPPKGFPPARAQEQDLAGYARGSYQVAAPDIEAVTAHREEIRCATPIHLAVSCSSRVHCMCASRSSMIARTRASAAAMLYIQNANAMTNIPVSIVVAMLGARVRLTDAPWWSVFHH